ncbi:hypothetical protein [Isachenkonia alkalipeptolytica]|uniref:Lipoprotein n=1 Tax=Isachenkonia alkalipeptolytica TaxID=2565777 RepID=A0AA43XLE8_9CLOT|nr:hypothetical protein [Isachenkonia alkalipeptolytica]NBG88862.1 hypothetical protein [Isachenkonia alkalipeptolytica]
MIKKILVLLVVGFMLLLAACNSTTEDPGEEAEDENGVAEEEVAEEEEEPADDTEEEVSEEEDTDEEDTNEETEKDPEEDPEERDTAEGELNLESFYGRWEQEATEETGDPLILEIGMAEAEEAEDQEEAFEYIRFGYPGSAFFPMEKVMEVKSSEEADYDFVVSPVLETGESGTTFEGDLDARYHYSIHWVDEDRLALIYHHPDEDAVEMIYNRN